MQNKDKFCFSFLGIPTFGEGGGGKPVGTKSQLWPKIFFWGSPNLEELTSETEYNQSVSSLKFSALLTLACSNLSSETQHIDGQWAYTSDKNLFQMIVVLTRFI